MRLKSDIMEKKEITELRSVKVFAPATVTNVGCGFDVLGFALEHPGDVVHLQQTDRHSHIFISIVGKDVDNIPVQPEQNTAGVPLLQMKKDFGIHVGLDVTIEKKLGIGSGLGSSAASAVGAVVAMNECFGLKLSPKQMLRYCAMGEAISSDGNIHIDNIAAALYGGFVFIHDAKKMEVISLPPIDEMYAVVLYPHLELKTSTMRKILKKDIPLSTAVAQWANLGAFIIGWHRKDYQMIKQSMQDVIVEPIRSQVIPGYDLIKETALEQDALGCSISGSGPSVFALVTNSDSAKGLKKEWEKIMKDLEIKHDVYISRINQQGPEVLS
ncbi:MAG: homoserine kinase [Calditrichia bacterium]